MALDNEELWWFGVWAQLPTGECACPRGTVYGEERDTRTVRAGECPKPGKHPWVMHLEGGERVGFPHGLRDAVPWHEWADIGRSVRAGGGRDAVAVPGSLWVLDVDNAAAWRGLTRLVRAGALPFESVLAADTTPRGWHVWVRTENPGWRTGAAQKSLNDLLDSIAAPRGLEVKSGGGYVIMPDGLQRRWSSPEALADRLTWSLGITSRWGSVKRTETASATVGAGEPPKAYAESPVDPSVAGLWEMWSQEQRAEWSQVPWNNLEAAAMRLLSAREGTRNIALNRTTWIEGRAAVHAGWERSAVERLLISVGVEMGLSVSECRATVRSALKELS